MPYEYLEHIALSDVAFRAWGDSMPELFATAADAALNVMVADLKSVEARVRRPVELNDPSEEMLLFNFLQELIYLKDAEQLLLRVPSVEIFNDKGIYRLAAQAAGERLDPLRHELIADVKAVTMHRFNVRQTPEGWEATVVLDV